MRLALAMGYYLRLATSHLAACFLTSIADSPCVRRALAQGFNFIFTCLPESHPALYEWLNYLDANQQVQTLEQRRWNGRVQQVYQYRYINDLPVRDTQPALMVNWCELTITREPDGVMIYRNAFITKHPISATNVADVVMNKSEVVRGSAEVTHD